MTEKMNLRIRKKDLVLILLFIPFITSNLTARIEPMWNIIQLADSLIICWLFWKRFKVRSLSTYMLLFSILVCGFTYLGNPAEFKTALLYSFRLTGFFLLMETIFQRDNNVALRFIVIIEGCIICFNTFFQFVNQGLWGQNMQSGNYYNFFASDNELIYLYLSYIATLAVYSWRTRKTIARYVYIMLGVCTLSIIRCWTATGMLGVIVMWTGLLLHIGKIKFVTFRKIMIVFSLTYVGVVVFRVHEIFGGLITKVLHKDLTLSSRTILWDYALVYLKRNWLIGSGTMKGGRFIFIPVNAAGDLYSVHSFFLEILLQTGICGLIIYILMYFRSGQRMMRHKDTEIYSFLIVNTMTLLLMYLSEGWLYHPLQYMLVLSMFYISSEPVEDKEWFRIRVR